MDTRRIHDLISVLFAVFCSIPLFRGSAVIESNIHMGERINKIDKSMDR